MHQISRRHFTDRCRYVKGDKLASTKIVLDVLETLDSTPNRRANLGKASNNSRGLHRQANENLKRHVWYNLCLNSGTSLIILVSILPAWHKTSFISLSTWYSVRNH